jgi:hypothetical protein
MNKLIKMKKKNMKTEDLNGLLNHNFSVGNLKLIFYYDCFISALTKCFHYQYVNTYGLHIS